MFQERGKAMSATLFALALFGCSDDGTACERLKAPAQTYRTQAQCTAKLDDSLVTDAAMRAEYPTVYAQCMTDRKLAAIGHRTVNINKIGIRFASAAD